MGKILKAEFNGDLHFGDLMIDASVLEGGIRVLSYRGVNRALGRSKSWSKGASELPPFLNKKALQPYITEEITAPFLSPIEYKPLHGGRTGYGVPAELLPEICNLWLRARKGGKLSTRDLAIADRAEAVISALAHVGIVALVDEATGYQETRDRYELQKILAKYIAKELLPWTLTFPHEFYQEMFRLRGWEYNATSKRKKPMYAGKLTRELIYAKLPKGVIKKLSRINPRQEETKMRKYHHHRFLTHDVGNPHLSKQIAVVTTLMKISPNWRVFQSHF